MKSRIFKALQYASPRYFKKHVNSSILAVMYHEKIASVEPTFESLLLIVGSSKGISLNDN